MQRLLLHKRLVLVMMLRWGLEGRTSSGCCLLSAAAAAAGHGSSRRVHHQGNKQAACSSSSSSSSSTCRMRGVQQVHVTVCTQDRVLH
jgi:hypothetical protein